jgi:glucokinase
VLQVTVGVDIGGTGTRFLAATADGRALARTGVRTPASLSAQERTDFFREHISHVAGGHGVAAIGIGASGPITRDGVIRNPDTLPAFTDTPLVAELERDFGVPVRIENDTVVAAIAEYELGSARGAPALLHLTLGTGIGAAVLVGGQPFRGGDGEHPEGGHIATTVPSAPCYCGRRQCWEQAASRAALQAAAAALLAVPADDTQAIAVVAERASAGDAAANGVFERYGAAVGDGLSTLLAVHRPTHVTLGGSAAVRYPLFAPHLAAVLRPLGSWISDCRVAASALGDYGGALGAALLAARAVGRPPTGLRP